MPCLVRGRRGVEAVEVSKIGFGGRVGAGGGVTEWKVNNGGPTESKLLFDMKGGSD